jgi:hypothetical protein
MVKPVIPVSMNTNKNILLHLFRETIHEPPVIKNAGQICQSVLAHWLKTINLRQVQCHAWHKYVSRAERYQMNKPENQQSKLEKLHSLGDKLGIAKCDTQF